MGCLERCDTGFEIRMISVVSRVMGVERTLQARALACGRGRDTCEKELDAS